ncbi:MAG TPA: aspartyl protease family protein [Lacibacter sp.]|nr:aspartyl protease family protein [Lacibacter sp.]
MMRWYWLLLMGLLAGRATAQVEEAPPAKLLTSFKFEQLTGGIVIVHATLDQLPDTLNFILDTGSGGISLDTLTAAYYKLPLQPSDRTVKGIGGVKNLHFYKDGTLHFKGLTVEHLDFHINDYQILTEVYGIRIDGIIGFSLLRRYIVGLDFNTQTISIYAPGHYKYPKNGSFLRPVFANIPVTRHEISDVKTYNSNFYFDTGAGMCLMLSKQFVKDSSFLSAKRKMVTTQVEGLVGKITMGLSVIRQVKIAGFKFKKVPAHIYDDSVNIFSYPSLVGLLGSDLLRRFNIVLNYPDRLIHLTPNSHMRDPFDYSYTGMNYYFIDGKVVITEIQQGSPAELAGIQPGDIIFGIDNNFSNSISQYKSLLQHAGQKVRMILFRDNKPIMVEMKIGSILK